MGIVRSIATLTIAALVLLFAAAIVGLALRPSGTKVRVHFAGYTNDSGGIPLVRLQIVNGGTITIRRMRQYTVEGRQQRADTRFLGARDALLVPGASEFVTIPAVANEGAWRASFLCFPFDLRTRLWERMGPMRISDLFSWKWRINTWLAPTWAPVYSGWIPAQQSDGGQQGGLSQ